MFRTATTSSRKPNRVVAAKWVAAFLAASPAAVQALDGGVLRVNPRNGWQAFEIITVGDDPDGDGSDWSMPGTFDGIGAWAPEPETLRVLVNHETSDATISEVDLSLPAFQSAIAAVIAEGSPGGISFVEGARQAYDRWSDDGGAAWTDTTGVANTSFARYCSGQSYSPDTFGPGRGFVDDIYITGEEVSGGRLFAIDLTNRDFYQVSGTAGGAPGGFAGMPFDAWENAAPIDTGETDHIAMLLSPDGGTQRMQLYIGEKGKNAAGDPSSDFLARNGLAYGSHYRLVDRMPTDEPSTDGVFSADPRVRGALISSKLEDVDVSPNDPTQVVLGDQDSGLFTFDFSLAFGPGGFDLAASGFSLTRIQEHADDVDGAFGDADNVDWTAATTLGGVSYPNGIILANEDTGTGNGEIWMMNPDGSALTKIGDTLGVSGATETTGILDVSSLVGYLPGSILLTNNQGSSASLTALIHPQATPIPEPSAFILAVALASVAVMLRRTRLESAEQPKAPVQIAASLEGLGWKERPPRPATGLLPGFSVFGYDFRTTGL